MTALAGILSGERTYLMDDEDTRKGEYFDRNKMSWEMLNREKRRPCKDEMLSSTQVGRNRLSYSLIRDG